MKPPAGRWAGHLRDAQRPAAASQTPTAAAFHARSSPPDAGAGPHAARAHRPGARGLTWARTPTLPAGTHTCVCIRDPHSCHSRHTRTDAESPLQGPPRGVTGTPSEPDVPRRGGSPARSALAEAPAGACSHRRALCPCSFPVAEANRGNGGGPHPEDAGPGAGEGTGLGPGGAGPRGSGASRCREAAHARSRYSFARISIALALVLFWVVVIHPLRHSLSTYFGSLCS